MVLQWPSAGNRTKPSSNSCCQPESSDNYIAATQIPWEMSFSMCLKHEKHTVNPACFLSILSGVTTLSCVIFAALKHHRRELASKKHYHRKLMKIQRTAPVTSEVILEIHVHQLCLICQTSLDHASSERIHMSPIHKSKFYDKCKRFWQSQNSHIVLLLNRKTL